MIKIILIFIIITLVLPVFSIAQVDTGEIKEKAPGILERSWENIKIFWTKFGNIFIDALKKAWDGAVRIWQKMWEWFRNIWNNYIWPKLEWLWGKITSIFKRRK